MSGAGRVQVTREAVEAAAKELSKAAYGDWADVLDGPRGLFRRDARAALEAALPFLRDSQ